MTVELKPMLMSFDSFQFPGWMHTWTYTPLVARRKTGQGPHRMGSRENCDSPKRRTSKMETLNTKPLSTRLRERLSEPAMLDLTKRLIAIPSENPPGNQYEECARTLFDELDRLGFDDVRHEGACVLASVGTGPRTLYFSGHYDVVPAQSRDQFQPRVEGANLFGRGSSDMKSGLAAMIHAAAAARDEGLLKIGRIGIVLVHRLSYTGAIVAFKMGRRQGGPSRTGGRRAHI
jgi:Peptidase family M20/M25/M40